MPLAQGLADVGEDVGGNVGRISAKIAERLARGEPLSQIFAAAPEQFPPMYRAIVEAGIRSGRLAAALEEMSASVRRLVALRRLVVMAMIYPLLVFFLCYGLFLLFVLKIAPTLLLAAPLADPPAAVHFIAGIRRGIVWWGPILPTLVLTAAVVWLYRSRRALVLHAGGDASLFGWVPSFRRLLGESRAAAFADIVALLVENRVPLAEAVVLAAESGGDEPMIVAARQLSAEISAGIVAGGGGSSADNAASGGLNRVAGGDSGRIVKRARAAPPIPPLCRWMIAAGSNRPGLAKALREAADTYRRRAVRRADWLRLYLPMLLTIGIGGTMTLIYALSLFVPWTATLYELTKP